MSKMTQQKNNHRFLILRKFWFRQMLFREDLSEFQILWKTGGGAKTKN